MWETYKYVEAEWPNVPVDNVDGKDEEGVSLLDLGTPKPELDQDPSDADRLREGDHDDESSNARKIRYRNKIRRVVRDNPDGITVPEIEALTDISRTTIRSHLEALCKLREVYRQRRSQNTVFYYPNGRPLHGVDARRIESGDVTMEVHLAQGPNDQLFFYVMEKRFSLLDGENTEGAIMVPVEKMDEFVDALHQMREEVMT